MEGPHGSPRVDSDPDSRRWKPRKDRHVSSHRRGAPRERTPSRREDDGEVAGPHRRRGKETVLERPPTPTANLREQKEIVRMAREQNAQAIVIECMAVDPELRRVSQDTLIRATLAVITNIRRDHLEVIGPDLGTGARNLSDVIPANGTVMTAEQRLLPTLQDEAQRRHAAIVAVNPDGVSDSLLESFPYITFKENVALALGACEFL